MFEIEVKNFDEIRITTKDKTININVAQSTIEAGLRVGPLKGAGEFEIGDCTINGIALSEGGVIYRINIEGVKLGIACGSVKAEELDELGPIDILATNEVKTVSIVEPKILIPIGNMDFAEIKAEVKVEKKLKIKKQSDIPAVLTIYKLD